MSGVEFEVAIVDTPAILAVFFGETEDRPDTDPGRSISRIEWAV